MIELELSSVLLSSVLITLRTVVLDSDPNANGYAGGGFPVVHFLKRFSQ